MGSAAPLSSCMHELESDNHTYIITNYSIPAMVNIVLGSRTPYVTANDGSANATPKHMTSASLRRESSKVNNPDARGTKFKKNTVSALLACAAKIPNTAQIKRSARIDAPSTDILMHCTCKQAYSVLRAIIHMPFVGVLVCERCWEKLLRGVRWPELAL